MTLRDLVLTVAVALLALVLVATSALTDLRSPERTAALAETLADDATVRALIVTGVVDAILEDATQRSGALAPLVPLVEPVLVTSISATLETPAGRAALGSALADALRQLTLAGPIVIDLRSAALAAAQDAPAPLDSLIRAAVAQGSVGLLVLGGDEDDDGPVDAPPPLATEDVGQVAGLAPGLARWLSALLLLTAVLTLVILGARDGRGGRLVAAGGALFVAGGITLLLLRVAPDAVTSRLLDALPDDVPISAVVPALIEGVTDLLTPTDRLGMLMSVTGAIAVVIGSIVRSSRTRL